MAMTTAETMPNIKVLRYSEAESKDYAGCVQPADFAWILYVRRDGGKPELHADRDPTTGAVPALQHLTPR